MCIIIEEPIAMQKERCRVITVKGVDERVWEVTVLYLPSGGEAPSIITEVSWEPKTPFLLVEAACAWVRADRQPDHLVVSR